MSFLSRIQNKSPEQKFRILWVTAIAVVILLIAAWVISTKFYKTTETDTTVFQSIGKGIKDVQDNFKKN